MKPISPKQHGVADYLFAGTAYALPRVVPASERVSRLLRTTALGVVGMSAVTRYELGLVKVLPMKAHIALDLALDAAFLAAPLFLRDESAKVKGALAGMGAAGTAVALSTRA